MKIKFSNIIRNRILLFTLLSITSFSETRSEPLILVHSLKDFKARGEKILLIYPEKNPEIIVTSQSIGSMLVRKGIAVYRSFGDSYVLQYFQLYSTLSSKGRGSKGNIVKWNSKDWILILDLENGDQPKIIKIDPSW